MGLKKIVSLITALLMLAAFCACTTPTSPDPQPTAAPEETTAPAETKAPETEAPAPTEEPTPEPATDEEKLSGFLGGWKYEDRDEYLRVFPDWTWEMLDGELMVTESGNCRYEDGYGLVLESMDGSDFDYLLPNDDDTIYNSVFEVLIPFEIPESTEELLLAPFLGTWKHEERDEYYVFYADWTWELLDGDRNVIEDGPCRYEEGYGLVLENLEGSDEDFLRFFDDGNLYNSAGYLMTRVIDPQ
ncbi:MAG: hypothetical protein IJM85_06455 [Clostridia bacterium]|nr:hypothetical protein [Clostridia bacterium]